MVPLLGIIFCVFAASAYTELGQGEIVAVNSSFSFTSSGNVSSSFTYNSYLSTVITCHSSQKPLKPSKLAELQTIVSIALENMLTLKPLGNRYSLTDIICTNGVPISMRRINHFRFDPISGLATVGAGATLDEFFEHLHQKGRTIINGIPAFSDVTIAGAIGTGTHGTATLTEPGTLADQLVSLVVVDGLGKVQNISDLDTLRAFKAHLGLLGIIYEVTFATVPIFKMEIRHSPVSDTILFETGKIMDYLIFSDRFQIWWFPTAKMVVLSVGNKVPSATPGACKTHYISEVPKSLALGLGNAIETMQKGNDHVGLFLLQGLSGLGLYRKVPVRTSIFHDPNKEAVMCSTDLPVGYHHKMVANKCKACAWDYGRDSLSMMDFGVAIPIHEFSAAIKTIHEIVMEYPVEFPLYTLSITFLSKSDGLMMMNGDKDSVMFEWMLSPRKDKKIGMMGLAASQAIMQALVEKHLGKPHWGKNGLYYSSLPVIKHAFPHFSDFLRIMTEFDPYGVFLNDFGRRLRFGVKNTSRDAVVKHCALDDDCICIRDEDCGDPKRKGALICGELKGFNVCRESPNIGYNYESFRGDVAKGFIGNLHELSNILIRQFNSTESLSLPLQKFLKHIIKI